MSTLETIGNFLWNVCKFINRKLTQFMKDEKVCNKKLERFLVDVDRSSIASQERTSDNDWLRKGAYQPVFTGPFCPLPEKREKDKVINIILK
jgi:hypothetical protein